MPEVKLDPVKSWNDFINALMETRDEWLYHKEVMQKFGNISKLPVEAQRQLRYTSVHKATDFERMLLQFVNRWRTSGGLDEMLIILPEKKKQKKEKKQDVETK